MKDKVVEFIKHHSIQLDKREAENFRPLDAGTYTHKTYGWTGRRGITNGLIVHLLLFTGEVKEVQLSNLDIKLDVKHIYKGAKKKSTTKPKLVSLAPSRASRLKALIEDLD